MEKSQQFVAIAKPPKLDAEHYGYWKVSIRQSIQSVDMEAWFAVEDGWTPPTVKNDAGETVLKSKKDWTADEKTAAKHNSQALSVIFNSLPMNHFTRVQGCVSAKEAWDILQVSFEGTSNVKRTRLDILASEFENLTMGDGDSIDDFSCKLRSIAQEAYDKDEVIRCIHISLLCVQENPVDRPTMSTVFQMLTNTFLTLPVPQSPGFFFRVRSEPNSLAERLDPGPSNTMSFAYSIDDASITSVNLR